MQVTLIGKNFIQKLTLPNVKIGNYWISYNENEETERKLLNIEGRGENWRLISSNYSKIIDPQDLDINNNEISIRNKRYRVINSTILKEYNMYCVKIGNEIFIVYCSPVYEDSIQELEIKQTREITIGKDASNDVQYNNILISDKHAKLTFFNGRWVIENYDTKFGVFVNDVPVSKQTRILVNGDIVFIMGLKIIIMGKRIFINNPLNQIKYNTNLFIPIQLKKFIKNEEPTEEENENITLNETYYSRSPRIINKIEREKIKIDPPPEERKGDEMPAILVLGTTISMGLIMVLSMASSFGGNSSESKGRVFFQFLLTILMFISIIVFPILQRKYEKNQKTKYEEKRQKRYKEYIDSKIREIDEVMTKQRNILIENYPSVEECMNIILSKSPRLWERKIENSDFLELRLGTGPIPLDADIQYPEKSFTMEDDNLVEILNTVANKSKILEDAPVAMSLIKNNITGLISKDANERKVYMKNLIMQLITFHSYDELKIVVLLDEDKEKRWDYLKMLPHTWNDEKTIRLFTDQYDEMKEISMYLEEEFKNRIRYQGANYKQFSPYYLIITDNYKKIENLKIITEILGTDVNVGFSLFCIASDLTQLPDESKTFITLENGEGKIYESEMTTDKQQTFKFDNSERIFFDKVSEVLLNIPIKFTQNGLQSLPNTYTFLQMYDAGNIEQLNTLERWRKNDSTLSLKAPIGIDNVGNTIYLDIHEKFHGPHGIIAGSTGSGKSEFLITYILSLAINYHPDDLSMIIIDYKGGGLAGAFQKGDIKLPHLVGTITNIDTVELQRSLDSIQSELRRRQIMFNEARNQTDEGTIDIYKYQKLYHNGVVDKPIPHLLIICDEFAELKQQQPDFMDELMSVSRIGRSLGVHLILATQKPAGIINDQIRSNSRFAVCLKVQNREESMDVIGRADAANLKNVGQFFLEVGNDEYFVLGQSAWAGAPYIPSYETKKTVDTSIDFISNIGTLIKKVDDTAVKKVNRQGEQLTNIVKYIYELAKREKVKTKQLWLPNIPETIYLDEIKEKYKVKTIENDVVATIGEYDDPLNQYQGIAKLQISNGGNAIIYGSADSGKETLLGTIVYDIMTSYKADQAWIYIFDFGSEALKIFKESPNVGDVVFMEDSEKTERFFQMIQNEIQRRKEILSNYNGDINLYIKSTRKIMPTILTIINNYEGFSELYQDKYEDILANITREGIKFGITFILTVNAYNSLRYRLSQNFKQKLALQMNNDDDYFNIFDTSSRKRPSRLFGRGLIEIDREIYEFQTAKICAPEEYNQVIKDEIEHLKEINNTKANSIPVMPKIVFEKNLDYKIKDIRKIPIGINKNTLNIETYDFTNNFVNIIATKDLDSTSEFISSLVNEFSKVKEYQIEILDAESLLQTKKEKLIENYKKLINEINTNIKVICIIIGIDRFIGELNRGDIELLELLKKTEEIGGYNFIIIDSSSKLKNHEFDQWYKKYITGDTGIWIGNGVDNQFTIRINSLRRDIVNNCGASFGYVIDQGETTMVKFIGINEKGDDENG